MKLDFREKFSLEIPQLNGDELVITGTTRELTKTELKEVKSLYDEDITKSKELKKLSKKFDRFRSKFNKIKDNLNDDELQNYYNKYDEFEEKIENLTESIENDDLSIKGFRVRFDKTIQSDQKDQLKQICEDFGYEKVFEAIAKDIEEKKPKESSN